MSARLDATADVQCIGLSKDYGRVVNEACDAVRVSVH